MSTMREVEDRGVDLDSLHTIDHEIRVDHHDHLRDDLTVTHVSLSGEKHAAASSNYSIVKKDQVVYVDFDEDDPRNPFNFSHR